MGEMHTMQDEAARRALKDDLTRHNFRIAQPDDQPLFTRSPQSAAQTVLWRWSDIEPMLRRLMAQPKQSIYKAALQEPAAA